jgi:hypothetical protein
MIHFSCPKCQARLRVRADKAGKSFRCPACRDVVKAPPPAAPLVAVGPAELANPPALTDQAPPAVVPPAPDPEPHPADDPEPGNYQPDVYPEAEDESREATSHTFLIASLIGGALMVGLLVVLIVALQGETEKEPAVAKAQPVERPPALRQREVAEEPARQSLPVPAAPKAKPKEEPAEAPPDVPTEPAVPKPQPKPADPPKPPREEPPGNGEEDDARASVFTKDLKSRKPTARIKAAQGLGAMGLKAKSASRALCEAMLDGNPDVALAATEALEKVNPMIHGLVLPLIVDKEQHHHAVALTKLCRLGVDGRPALPVLLAYRAKRNGGPLVVQAIAEVAPKGKELTAQFCNWLATDKDPQTRTVVARALPRMEAGRSAVNVLALAMRTDENDLVREAAACSLGEMGAGAKEAKRLLAAAKTDPSERVRQAAATALKKVEADEKD